MVILCELLIDNCVNKKPKKTNNTNVMVLGMNWLWSQNTVGQKKVDTVRNC